jgi:alkylated DNA repair dioxygenase AlkB
LEDKKMLISGLTSRPGYISSAEVAQWIAQIDAQPWLTDLKRRVQHYGYRYDYKSRRIDPDMYLGALPSWIAPLAQRLFEEGYSPAPLDQVIVNEYLPGQGIAPHVDCIPCFGESIISLSLGGPCVMAFSPLPSGADVPLLLESGSLLVMQGEARYRWKHGIPARKSDVIAGQVIPRGRRLSLTFRQVI